jgi:ABC-type amino acid transport substrate-binding protein
MVSLLLTLVMQFTYSQTASASDECDTELPNCTTPTFVQCGIPNENQLSVAVRDGPPFVFEDENPIPEERQLKGIAIDLWELVADELSIDYQYVCLSLTDTRKALENGTLDIAISPLTITKEREQQFDFSHQYFSSGLVFASGPSETRFDFEKAFNTLANVFHSKNVLYLALVFSVLFSLLVYLAIKNIDSYQSMPIMKEKSKPAMVMHVVFFSILNISGLRKDIFGFSSVRMQAFSFLILIVGVTVSASLFSMVTAALAQSITADESLSVSSLNKYTVSTLQGSTAENFINDSNRKPIELHLTDNWEQALVNISLKKNSVVLGDWAQLVYLAQSPDFQNKVTIQSQSFQFEPYGWGFKNNHPIRDSINQELIGLLRDGTSNIIIESYIGSDRIDL